MKWASKLISGCGDMVETEARREACGCIRPLKKEEENGSGFNGSHSSRCMVLDA